MTAVTEIWAYRSLIYNLAQRELRARYKKSLLGWLWSLINPASMLLIYSVVFGVFLRQTPPPMGNGTDVFALYLFAGLYVWNLFNGTVMGAIAALQAGGLLNKVYFPPACPAIANTITVVLQAIIEGAILALVMVIIGNVSITFLLFPLLLVFVTMFAIGIGLALSVYNIYYRDVGYLVGILMNLLFYATPIIYPLSIVPEQLWGLPMRRIISLNPISQFVEWSRDAFYLLQWPSLSSFLGVILTSVVTFVVGWSIFVRKSRNITEEL
ncbi:ABC transporter permease [Rhabdothermincola salaria]|uniref:ABC transporter permease n=1 Tax=Rhabdothermincola salaria TaxID=2903142 RepID=UPI001E52D67E|nr:ABC transporter permease [Rhabdothermincola salaria]MCD9623365.1 ABC transporter permease [Rhabdothermincola salaria]